MRVEIREEEKEILIPKKLKVKNYDLIGLTSREIEILCALVGSCVNGRSEVEKKEDSAAIWHLYSTLSRISDDSSVNGFNVDCRKFKIGPDNTILLNRLEIARKDEETVC